jgi:hypothetical protein
MTNVRSRDSAVGIATGYGLDRGDGVRAPVGSRFSLFHVEQIGSGIHPAGTGALSPRVKRPWCEAENSPPASAEVKKMCISTSTPPYAFIA